MTATAPLRFDKVRDIQDILKDCENIGVKRMNDKLLIVLTKVKEPSYKELAEGFFPSREHKKSRRAGVNAEINEWEDIVADLSRKIHKFKAIRHIKAAINYFRKSEQANGLVLRILKDGEDQYVLVNIKDKNDYVVVDEMLDRIIKGINEYRKIDHKKLGMTVEERKEITKEQYKLQLARMRKRSEIAK